MAEELFYDEQGFLTRKAMQRIHAEGGSILHDKQIYPPNGPLPSLADLAKRSPILAARALEDLRRQQTEIEAQAADLKAQLALAESPAPDTSAPAPDSLPPADDSSEGSSKAKSSKGKADEPA